MSSVIIQGDSSGSVTLQAPAAAGSTVINLPSTSMNIGQGGGNVSTNTAFGASALAANTTGANNIAVGYQALTNNTTANQNIAIGINSLVNTTTGGDNTGVGANAMQNNTTGVSNTAIGRQALLSNTTASNNTAVGYQSGYSNQTGSWQTAFGVKALYSATAGDFNVAIGGQAAYSQSTASYTVAIGQAALYLNTTGAANTAIGYNALYSNTTASNNTAVGYQAGYTNSTGEVNTFVGHTAGYAATGNYNTFIGQQSGNAVTTGTKNTIIGRYTGNQGGLDIRTANNYIVLSDGDGNPRIYNENGPTNFGNGAVNAGGTIRLQDVAASNYGPVIVGRTGAIGSTTDQWIIGSNSAIKGGTAYNTFTVIASTTGGVNLTSGATSWTSASDARLKNITGTYTNALEDVSQIEAVKFTWKADENAKPCVGVIAQSVQNVVPEAVETIRVSKDDETDYLSVRYTELIPLMIASIQQLNAKVEAQAVQIAAQAAEIATLKGQA